MATEIVQCDNLEERVCLLKKFISIAEHSRAISNYKYPNKKYSDSSFTFDRLQWVNGNSFWN